MMRGRPALLATLALALATWMPAQAQKAGALTVYRCTDAHGQVTFQNGVPCPRGHTQQARTLEAPTPPPPPPPAVPTPAATSPAAAPPVASHAPVSPAAPAGTAPAPLPPPPLYRCSAWNGGNSYLSEDGQPPARCDALVVRGIDGGQNLSGARACEMRQDHCERIPDAELCEAWSHHDRQAESLVQLGNPELAERATALHARTRRVMTATACAIAP